AACDLMSDPRANRLPGSADRVRPEHLHLEGRPGDIAFPARVLALETNGSETFLHAALLEAQGGDGSRDGHWVARLPGLVSLEAGADVMLHAAEASLHRFQPAGLELPRG
ncbi:MAG: TOBE domain-containing protein, partial [Pseudomonadota bacterium]